MHCAESKLRGRKKAKKKKPMKSTLKETGCRWKYFW
jgi:hypothetical protein